MLMFKDDPDFAKHNQDATAAAQQELKEMVAQVESLQGQIQDLNRDVKDVFTVLKSKGYNVKAFRKVLAYRKADKMALQETEDAFEQYKSLLDL